MISCSSISSIATVYGGANQVSSNSKMCGTGRSGLRVESTACQARIRYTREARNCWRAISKERPDDGSLYLIRSRRRGDGPISGGEVNRLFHAYATAADLPADRRHVHVLRHSIGVHLANADWDIADVQDWLGHRDISSTLMYFRITNKRREAKYRSALRSREIARTDGG